jgi:hypothetical protein
MPSFGTRNSRCLGWAAFVAVLACCPGSAARAQGFGPDPYKPYNSRFEPFVYPQAPGPLDYGYNQGFAPGAERAGVRGANQFENYLDSLRGGNARTGGGTGAGAGRPYFRTDRSLDTEAQYQPNRLADEKFERYQASQEEVSKLYFRYLRERDPKKRAEVFREYTKARNQANRELSTAPGSRRAAASRTSRRGTAPRPLDSSSSSRRAGSPPPATRAEAGITGRGRDGGARSSSTAGAAPSPLDDSMSELEAPKGATPSQVLERALRNDPPGRGARPRRPSPSSVGAPPPPN